MKRFLVLTSVLIAAVAFVSSCSKGSDPAQITPENQVPPTTTTTIYSGTAEFVVPAGTMKVFVHYNTASSGAKVLEIPVTPKVATPTNGRDPEPFGTVKLTFQSDVATQISISTTSNSKNERVYCLENFPITTKLL